MNPAHARLLQRNALSRAFLGLALLNLAFGQLEKLLAIAALHEQKLRAPRRCADDGYSRRNLRDADHIVLGAWNWTGDRDAVCLRWAVAFCEALLVSA